MGEHGRYHHSLAGVVKGPERNAILSFFELKRAFFLPWELVLPITRAKNSIWHGVDALQLGMPMNVGNLCEG